MFRLQESFGFLVLLLKINKTKQKKTTTKKTQVLSVYMKRGKNY